MYTQTLDEGRYHRKEDGKSRMRSDAVTMWVLGTTGEAEPNKEIESRPQFEPLATTI